MTQTDVSARVSSAELTDAQTALKRVYIIESAEKEK